MLIITGTGRSGTSLIAKWLKECNALPYEGEWVEQFYAGYEPPDVSRINSAIWIGNDAPMQTVSAQESAIKGIKHDIVKDPKFFYGNVLTTWLSVRKDLKFFVCIRNFHNVERSRKAVNQITQLRNPEQLRSDFGSFLSTVIINQLPYEIVCFPEFLDEYDMVYRKITTLHPELKLTVSYQDGKDAWEKVVNKSLVHF